jgi:hypothetical protein
VRQTNIVWTLFIAVMAGVRILDSRGEKFMSRTLGSFNGFHDLAKFLNGFIIACIKSLPFLLSKLWAFVLVLISFACFFVVNGGIVLGKLPF